MGLNHILLSDIDISSQRHDRFIFSYARDLNVTMDSIRNVGLINPVILNQIHLRNEAYTIVCGYQRIKAFRKLGEEKINAKVIEGLSDEELSLLSLHDNMFSRGFNEVEKAIVIKKFQEIGYSYDRLMSEINPLLGIPPNKKVLDKYLSILKLNREIKNAVAKNELELEKAFLLIMLDNAERDYVYRVLFKETSPNINEAKEMIRNLLDLGQIKQKSISELLTSGEISNVLSVNRTNKRQKGEMIYKLIKSMRYPTISRKEDEFARSCNALSLDNNVRITHSRFFEGDDIQITIKVSDEEKLRNSIEKFLSNIKNGAFKRIFSAIR
jgi:ParB-like chromosome segregation protein Spo0J